MNKAISIHPEGLEKCVWKQTLENNARGLGTSFNVESITEEQPINVCYNHCDGYGRLTFDLRCEFYTEMYKRKK